MTGGCSVFDPDTQLTCNRWTGHPGLHRETFDDGAYAEFPPTSGDAALLERIAVAMWDDDDAALAPDEDRWPRDNGVIMSEYLAHASVAVAVLRREGFLT